MTTAETTGARFDWETFKETVPEVLAGMAPINHAYKKSGMERDLFELIKIRASQINGCAYCLQYHLNEARKLNVAPEKLDQVATWHEAGIFSQREAAAIEWTERVTLLAVLTTAISQINFWNRLAAPFRFTPPIPRSVA
jgi:AhpD family alkylhydroperoxidase